MIDSGKYKITIEAAEEASIRELRREAERAVYEEIIPLKIVKAIQEALRDFGYIDAAEDKELEIHLFNEARYF